MRRRLSLICLLAAWLCANGAAWHIVQVVAWAKMFNDYAQVMPVKRALALTFDGTAPCGLCEVAQTAQDDAREKLPDSAALGALEKFVSATEAPPAAQPPPPEVSWPGAVHDIGRTRTERVPVPPPRA